MTCRKLETREGEESWINTLSKVSFDLIYDKVNNRSLHSNLKAILDMI